MSMSVSISRTAVSSSTSDAMTSTNTTNATSVSNAKKSNSTKISSPYDWVQIKAIATTTKDIKRIFVVSAGITLFNIHRVFLFSGKYRGDLGIEHFFFDKQ